MEIWSPLGTIWHPFEGAGIQGFTMGLGNDMGLHKRHGETVGLENTGNALSLHWDLQIPVDRKKTAREYVTYCCS